MLFEVVLCDYICFVEALIWLYFFLWFRKLSIRVYIIFEAFISKKHVMIQKCQKWILIHAITCKQNCVYWHDTNRFAWNLQKTTHVWRLPFLTLLMCSFFWVLEAPDNHHVMLALQLHEPAHVNCQYGRPASRFACSGNSLQCLARYTVFRKPRKRRQVEQV